jgi:hypothetical protein
MSVVIACASGVLTGLRGLDRLAVAPWVRSVILLGALTCLAAVAWLVSRTLEKTADEKEASSGPLLRKKVVGPPRRWAIWISTLSTACVVSYLLNEHRPATSTLVDLLPANVLDLAASARTRTWPWSWPAQSDRPIREDDDVIGAISRMSPPLLLAMCLALTMFVATYFVGVYEPTKLLGGFGVLGLFAAGLLAAPALLRVQGAAMEPVWRQRGFDAQRHALARMRVFVVRAHRILVVVQVVLLGVALGTMTSGSVRAVPPSRLSFAAIIAGIVGFVLARMLWRWTPNSTDEGPICTDVLASREHQLMELAGWALVIGSICSLTAVLID